MALQSTDLFLIQRDDSKYNTSYLQLNDAINSSAVLLTGNQDNIAGVKGFIDPVTFTSGTTTLRTEFSGATSPNGEMGTNALDQFQEGIWIPTPAGAGAVGTWTVEIKQGFYTRVGRLVTVTFDLAWTVVVGATGNFLITNLPFPVTEETYSYGACVFTGFDIPEEYGSPVLYARHNSSRLQMIMSPKNDIETSLLVMDVPEVAGTLKGTVSYITGDLDAAGEDADD